MRKFLKIFWAFYKGFAPAVPVEFDEDDRELLMQYLSTRSGRRFNQNLMAQSFEQDRLATLERKEPLWMAGVATGLRMVLAQIDQFTVSPAESGEEYETIPEKTGAGRFDQNSR